jgi:GntR family transcriptional regulator/MocR family aminotransferase
MLYGDFRNALVDHINQQLRDRVDVLGDEAGMHLTIALKDGRSDLEISERAGRLNLSLWPLSPSYLGAARNGFILGYGGTTLKEIPNAVRKIRTLLN